MKNTINRHFCYILHHKKPLLCIVNGNKFADKVFKAGLTKKESEGNKFIVTTGDLNRTDCIHVRMIHELSNDKIKELLLDKRLNKQFKSNVLDILGKEPIVPNESWK